MDTTAREAPGWRPASLRQGAGWATMALACVGVVYIVTRDFARGSLEVGVLDAGAAFGLFAVAVWAKSHAAGRAGVVATDVVRTGAVAVQLLVLAAAITALQIESPAFYEIVIPLAFTGFLIHHALPQALRPPFFVALSFGTLGLVFGPVDAAWLIGLGVVLIALCHAPLAWLTRVLLVGAVGGGYALLRTGRAETPWSAAIWPILGSMFMFRLIVYLHHLKHAKKAPGVWRSLSYFFLLPNVMFPLFPVIDFKTFERTYYQRDAHAIYQRGVRWMLLGVAHLIAYRMVYHHVILPQAEVQTAVDLGRQMAGNFMIYLRVSGQFHLIVGMLHLFGFGLPETNRFFFLTSGFNDFWRRINIYWKDFMMKTFYYPSVFVVKKHGMAVAVVAGTAFVFFLNWLLHAYQWFWVVGVTPVSATDTAFWVILGAAVAVNGLWELRKGRDRSLGGDGGPLPLRVALMKALKVVAFFCTISVLWSMWTAPTFAQWLVLLDIDLRPDDLLVLGGALAMALLGVTAFLRLGSRQVDASAPPVGGFSFGHAGLGAVAATALLVVATPATFSGADAGVQRFAQTLRVEALNRADSEVLTRGYYERLTGVNQFNQQLWGAYAAQSGEEGWEPFSAGMVPMVQDYRRRAMAPLFGDLTPQGWVTTNSDGMHDREYDRERAPNTLRVAMMGPSFVASAKNGTGYAYEAVAEARLANERARGEGPDRHVEILNFGVPGHTMPQQLFLFEEKVKAYRPDVVILGANQQDVAQILTYVSWLGRRGFEAPPPHGGHLNELVARFGIDSTTVDAAAVRDLEPYKYEILGWSYRQLVEAVEAAGAEAVWIYSPLAMERDEEIVAIMRDLAEEAGFETYDLQDALEGYELSELAVSSIDAHLNRLGDGLVGAALADLVRELEARTP